VLFDKVIFCASLLKDTLTNLFAMNLNSKFFLKKHLLEKLPSKLILRKFNFQILSKKGQHKGRPSLGRSYEISIIATFCE